MTETHEVNFKIADMIRWQTYRQRMEMAEAICGLSVSGSIVEPAALAQILEIWAEATVNPEPTVPDMLRAAGMPVTD